jgi:uncharacterized membrane protein HdeD (DUF308 family)
MHVILKNWWLLTIKGMLTFMFGILATTTQLATDMVFSKVFGTLLILCGLLLLMIVFKERKNIQDRNWRLTEGFIDLIIGLILIAHTQITVSEFLSIITIWISFMGVLQISNGYRLRGLYNHYWILIFNGILAIAFAILVFTQPIHTTINMMILIGLYTTVFGGFLIISSLYIRKIIRDIDTEIPNKIGDEANQELSYY